MAAVAFDTLKLSRTLRDKAKLSPEQAEGFADALSEAVQSDLATKGDAEKVRSDLTAELGKVRTELKGEIDLLRSEVKAEIATAKTELMKWSIGQMFVLLGAMFAMFRFAGRF